jgi:hypothetical protein
MARPTGVIDHVKPNVACRTRTSGDSQTHHPTRWLSNSPPPRLPINLPKSAQSGRHPGWQRDQPATPALLLHHYQTIALTELSRRMNRAADVAYTNNT